MPPSEPPRSSRPRRRKPKPRAAQPPSSTARQGAAFGSRPAKPLPKPRPAPAPRAPRMAPPTPQQVRNARAQRTAIVSSGKAVSAAAYRAQPVKARRRIVATAKATPAGQRTPEQQAALSVHHSRHVGDVRTKAAYGQTRSSALAQRDAIMSSALAVTSAAKAADRAAAKVEKAKPKETGKTVKIGGINTHLKPGVVRVIAKSLPHVQDIVPLFDRKGHDEAPAETALNNLDRGRNAVMTATKAGIKQHGGGMKGLLKSQVTLQSPSSKAAKVQRHAFTRGLELKDKTSGSDVLKEAGVKSPVVRAIGGTSLDFAVGSATLPVGGVGSTAARSGEVAAAKQFAAGARDARIAARGAERGAAARGASKAAARAAGKEAKRVARARARVAAERARTRAIDPEAAAKHVETLQARTARLRKEAERLRKQGKHDAAAHVDKRVKGAEKRIKSAQKSAAKAERQHGKGQGIGVRIAGQEVPGVRRATAAVGRGARKVTKSGPAPTEAERASKTAFQRAERSARAGKEQASARAKRVAKQAVRDLTPDEHQQVLHALDTGNIKALGNPRLIRAATDLKAAFAHTFRAEKQAGVTAVRHPEDFLKKGDVDKLKTTIQKAEQSAKTQVKTARAAKDDARVADKQARLAAVRSIPQRGRGAGVPITETHAAWLRRVKAHADQHGLKLVSKRAEKLLAKQPKPEDVAQGYFPREFTDRAAQQAGVAGEKAPPSTGATTVRGKTSRTTAPATGGRARSDPRRFDILQAERKAEGKPPLEENVPLVAGSRIRSGERVATEATFARDLAESQGRRVTHESQVKDGEKLFVLGRRGGKYGLHPVDKVARSAEREWNRYHAAVAKARTQPHPEAAEPGSAGFREAITKANRVQGLIERGATPGERAAAKAARDRVLARYHLRMRNGNIEAARDTGESIPKPTTPRGRGERGQHYAIPQHLVDRMDEANKPTPAIDSRAIRIWDKTTAGFKVGATYNPAFHLRNAYGDILRLMEMPGNPIANVSKLRGGRTAARAIRQSDRYRQAPGKLFKTDPFNKATIKVAGKDMPARDFVGMLRKHKLLDVGRAQQERHEAALLRGDRSAEEGNILRGGKWTGGLRARGGPFRGAVGRTFSQDTPNAIRAAAFKAGLDRGLTEGQAADAAHKFFVDYGRLSAAERQIGRRIFPFYTWTAKSLPVTLANYALHPARYENLNSARNEWNQSVTGLSSDELAKQMKGFTRNNLPIVIPIGHGRFAAVSASWPANLVQFAPGGLGPHAALDEAGKFRALGGSQLNWVAKTLIDGASAGLPGGGGFDLKTGKPIENADRPRVPAPSWAADLPDWAKKDLLVAEGPDAVSGKKILKWRGWAQWALRAQPVSLARQATGFADTARQGKINTPAAKVAEFLGVTVEDLGPDVTKANEQIKLYQRSAELNKKIHQLPEGVGKDNPTPEWRRLRDELNTIQRKIRPNKPKKGTGIDLGLGTGSQTKIDLGLGSGPKTGVDLGLGG